MPYPIPPDLPALAAIVDAWLDTGPRGIPSVYLFGSRVRGDHRPDSDVDLRLKIEDWSGGVDLNWWWTEQNEQDFSALKDRLPGRLSLHSDDGDACYPTIDAGLADPVLRVGRVACVWTPPKPPGMRNAQFPGEPPK